MAYQGSTEIASGLIPRRASAGNDFPLISDHYIQVGDDDTSRLDDVLAAIGTGGASLPPVSSSNNSAVLQVANGQWSIGIKIVVLTEADDEALPTHDPNTLYIIVRASS